ncbi:MAG: flippase-like domain-containing protein [Anaerolineae bacterium]|nr:flippase-like domain-containing protein [Anaerolineae bacterium]
MSEQQSPESPQKPKNTLRKRLIGIAQIVLSIGLLTWLFSTVDMKEIGRQFAGMNLWLYGAAILMYLVSVFIRSIRWQIMLKPLGVDVSLFELFRLYLLGFFWNSFLPTGFGGDVVKIIALREMSKKGAESAMSVLAERAVGLLGTSLIALVVLAIWPRLVSIEIMLIVGGIAVGVLAVGWLARLDILRWLEEKLPFLKPVVTNKSLVNFHQAVRTYDTRTFMLGILSSLPFTISLIVINYLIGIALNVDVQPYYYAIFTPVVSVVNMLPLSFNGLGVREYMYTLLFVPLGVSEEAAITMALAFNFLRLGTGALGGLFSMVSGMRSVAKSPDAAGSVEAVGGLNRVPAENEQIEAR